MNIKEAKEIIKNTPPEFNLSQPRVLYFEAKAVLETLNGPEVRELFESANEIEDILEVPEILGDSSKIIIQKAIDRFREALSKFKEAIK